MCLMDKFTQKLEFSHIYSPPCTSAVTSDRVHANALSLSAEISPYKRMDLTYFQIHLGSKGF